MANRDCAFEKQYSDENQAYLMYHVASNTIPHAKCDLSHADDKVIVRVENLTEKQAESLSLTAADIYLAFSLHDRELNLLYTQGK